ncbi:MAG: hypothetical protein K2N03_04545 [Muribaculaceae bacterium]|nr:hypothetical protein [Muribaculaceae bacterium]
MKHLIPILLFILPGLTIFANDAVKSIPTDSLPVENTGMKTITIPDSLYKDVELLLTGYYKVKRDNSKIDLTEKTIFNGDTIPMVLKDRNLGRFDRGLFNYLFIPKGMWQFGLTASYGEFSTSDMELMDLLSDIDISAHSFALRPYLAYFIRNNISVGLRFGYNETKARIDSFKVDIDEDMNFNLHDIGYTSAQYTGAIFVSQYFGITRRGRFGVSNEVELAFSSGSSDFNRPFNSEIKRTHTSFADARITFSPGLCVFIMKNASLNVSFGAFGFYLRNSKQTVDGVSSGNRLTSGANFRINIFNISLGLGIHI